MRKLREIVFQILYSYEYRTDSEILEVFLDSPKWHEEAFTAANKRAEEIKPFIERMDEKIQEHSKAYELQRISSVEKCVLRLALFEIICDESVPDRVAISEAVRLTRKYGSRESAGFVNGVLDSVLQAVAC